MLRRGLWARGLLICVLAVSMCSVAALRRESDDDHGHHDGDAEQDHAEHDHSAEVGNVSRALQMSVNGRHLLGFEGHTEPYPPLPCKSSPLRGL